MPELRIDPICGRRVYIAEDRGNRPNDYAAGSASPPAPKTRQAPCPFCAGNESSTPEPSATVVDESGRWRVRVVPNKFPAVSLTAGVLQPDNQAPLSPHAAVGAHEVIIESPEHFTLFSQLDADQLAIVLSVYRDRLRHWATEAGLRHAIVFKNAGCTAGASLEHVHSQLIALPYVTPTIQAELDGSRQYFAVQGRCAFCELVRQETAAADRVVSKSFGYLAISAFAGRQPYETWILPERHSARFDSSTDEELLGLATILHETVGRLASVCSHSGHELAYNLVLHTGPFGPECDAHFHWHWELIPRTTNLAGLEWGAGVYINSVSPERAARELRAV